MMFKSNFDEVAAGVREIAHAIDFDKRMPGGRYVGELILEATAVGIVKRSVIKQVDPQGVRYAKLNPAYLRWKVKHGYSPRKNVQTGLMLSLEEIRGERRIERTRARMEYGRSERTRQLAAWAEEGQRNRPSRRFYDTDPDIEAKVNTILEDAAERAVARASGR